MDVLIFDMDGVLVDVSKSYRKTIQQTIQIYLKTCMGFQRQAGDWVTDGEISLFKSAGGFNNDWDLTSGLLLYLLSVSGIPPLPKQKRFSSIEENLYYLKTKTSKFRQKKIIRLRRRDRRMFLEKVKRSGGGLRGIHRVLGTSWDGWVYRSGDLNKNNLIKRIFQEIYLGEKFSSHYDLPRLFYKEKGLYRQEKMLVPKKILSTLRKKIQMGIASGRPRFEAELALKRFRLFPYFKSMVTLNECEEEETRLFRLTGKKTRRSKPHPYSILRAVQEIGIPRPICGYVGDVVDDMIAAQRAKKDLNLHAIAFLHGPNNKKTVRELMIQAGADVVIQDPRELFCFVFKQNY
ncbi:MAG: HAD family hydrolase [Syntrophaceae bacterium]|nr:HAD family hydrolase [Syntrophaceae bacterium]